MAEAVVRVAGGNSRLLSRLLSQIGQIGATNELPAIARKVVEASRACLTLPGIAVRIGDALDALRRIAGDKVADRVEQAPDPKTQKIVDGWPFNFTSARALAMGYEADASIDEIIQAHIEDELDGKIAD